jgi:2-polyprenyl-3-methyl-5-hydroxy-6-metoxy-1,4-benzoquinol methylase
MPVDMNALNEDKLHEFVGKLLGDLGGAFSVPLVRIGDKLGLYDALFEAGTASAAELAQTTGTTERYIREWACAQAASGYLDYDDAAETFTMTPEQAMVFGIADSPVALSGAFEAAAAAIAGGDKVGEAFKSGEGVGWGDQATCLFCATAKFFRPGYTNHIVQEWLPALDGVVEKLQSGAKVADVGCGHGISTVIMAEAFPNSNFVGFDFHPDSIHHARQNAEEAGVSNVSFETALAKEVPADNYDFVALFDCLHDMGDPEGALKHLRSTMASDGSLMIVEPMAGDSVSDNLNPVGRLYYSASTVICVPTSLAQEVGLALGAQAGEKRLSEVITGAGFSSTKRATETPFNMILEARP